MYSAALLLHILIPIFLQIVTCFVHLVHLKLTNSSNNTLLRNFCFLERRDTSNSAGNDLIEWNIWCYERVRLRVRSCFMMIIARSRQLIELNPCSNKTFETLPTLACPNLYLRLEFLSVVSWAESGERWSAVGGSWLLRLTPLWSLSNIRNSWYFHLPTSQHSSAHTPHLTYHVGVISIK